MRLALPTVCSVSLTASVCQVFGNDCTEFDFGDHPVTVLSGPRTHRRGQIFCHTECVLEIQPSWLYLLSHLNGKCSLASIQFISQNHLALMFSVSLTFVSVEHIVCPATSTVISTITCSGEGFCLSKRTWVEGRPLGVRTSEYSSVCYTTDPEILSGWTSTECELRDCAPDPLLVELQASDLY